MFTPISVNSDRLFNKVPRYFGSIDAMATEVIQNAYRATFNVESPRITIKTFRAEDKDLVVIVEDNGCGITDAGAMLSLAVSGWSPTEIEPGQDPAGLGVCGILAFCSSVTWASHFGELTVDSDQFFTDPAYRASLEHAVIAAPFTTGTRCTLRLREKSLFPGQLFSRACEYYPPSVWITIDGVPVGRTAARDICGPLGGSFDAPGCTVFWAASEAYRGDRSCVLWHGHYIRLSYSTPTSVVWRDKVYSMAATDGRSIVVEFDRRSGTEVTPKLPDRTELAYDEKTTLFVRNIAQQVVQQAVDMTEAYLIAAAAAMETDGAGPKNIYKLPSVLWLAMRGYHFKGEVWCDVGFQAADDEDRAKTVKGNTGVRHYARTLWPVDTGTIRLSDTTIVVTGREPVMVAEDEARLLDFNLVDAPGRPAPDVVYDPDGVKSGSPGAPTHHLVIFVDRVSTQHHHLTITNGPVLVAFAPITEDNELQAREVYEALPSWEAPAVIWCTESGDSNFDSYLVAYGQYKEARTLSSVLVEIAQVNENYQESAAHDNDEGQQAWDSEVAQSFDRLWLPFHKKVDTDAIRSAVQNTFGVELYGSAPWGVSVTRDTATVTVNGVSTTYDVA